MEEKEKLAFAVLKSGGSFKEAADASELPVENVMSIWQRNKNSQTVPRPVQQPRQQLSSSY